MRHLNEVRSILLSVTRSRKFAVGPLEHYNIAMTSIDKFARTKLDSLQGASLLRVLREAERQAHINFCSNDYLGLSQDERLKAAAVAALNTYGAGAGSSRLVTGNHPLYAELEGLIATLKGTEGALVFGSGYLANLGAIAALAGAEDLVLADELSHACMMAGAKLSGARTLLFRHNDIDHLRALLGQHRATGRNCYVLTEGVFSMDGDLAPLPDIIAAAHEYDAWVITDDAHGLGVVGEGRGSAAHWGVAPDVQIGTLSKSAGSYGGYVAASRTVIEFLINRARSLIYSTGLPPSVVAASIAGINIIANDSAICAKPLAIAQLFAAHVGLPPAQSAIVPLIVGSPDSALAASRVLEREGFVVAAIRPPTVPDNTARLRLTFSATHRSADVLRFAAVVRERIHTCRLAAQ